MRVLHVCESIIGGTGSYLAEITTHQVRKYGAENVALLIPDSQMCFLDATIAQAAPIIIKFRRPSRFWGALFLVFAYLKALFDFRPDIVHAHSSIAGAITRILRFPYRSRIVFCPHGWSVDMIGARRIRGMAAAVERMLAKLPDRVIVISHHEYNRALEIGVRSDRLSLIPNGISRETPAVEPAQWDDDRIKVLYAGRFDYQKGVDILLEAIKGLEDRINVRLVGDVAVDGKMPKLQIPPSVTWLGWLDRDDVIAQMKSCDVLVVPSRWEGFGLVVVEAMRLSKPVVATAVGGLQEILGKGRFGYLVPPENPKALHDLLHNLNRDDLERVGKLGRERFLTAYTSDRMVQDIDNVYLAIIAKTMKKNGNT